MSRSSALILLGVLVVIAPLSGLPQSWIAFILAIIGIIIMLIGIAIRADSVRRARDAAFAPSTLPVAESSPAADYAEATPASEESSHQDHHHPSSIA